MYDSNKNKNKSNSNSKNKNKSKAATTASFTFDQLRSATQSKATSAFICVSVCMCALNKCRQQRDIWLTSLQKDNNSQSAKLPRKLNWPKRRKSRYRVAVARRLIAKRKSNWVFGTRSISASIQLSQFFAYALIHMCANVCVDWLNNRLIC